MKPIALLLMVLLSLIAPPAPPTLTIWTANDRGRADLIPGGLVIVVIELRSEAYSTAFAQHLPPAGLSLESASASTGIIVTTPFVSWTGVVSATQRVNLVLHYRVAPDPPAGRLVLRAQAQVAGVLIKASTTIRVVSVMAPPRVRRVYLPIIR